MDVLSNNGVFPLIPTALKCYIEIAKTVSSVILGQMNNANKQEVLCWVRKLTLFLEIWLARLLDDNMSVLYNLDATLGKYI